MEDHFHTGYGFGGTGMKANNNSFEKYGESFTQGDIIGYRLLFAFSVVAVSI